MAAFSQPLLPPGGYSQFNPSSSAAVVESDAGTCSLKSSVTYNGHSLHTDPRTRVRITLTGPSPAMRLNRQRLRDFHLEPERLRVESGVAV